MEDFMYRIGFLFISLFLCVWVACSADSSTAAEETTEITQSTEMFSSSSIADLEPPYGIILIDTTKEYIHNLDGNITSSSKTEYVFATERTSIVQDFMRPSIIINAYYEENGLQFSGSDENASRNIAYLLVSEGDYKYSGWLLSNTYWDGNEVCENELDFFKNECNQYNGEFVDYQENSCQTRKLSLSCVYPTSSTDDKMHLDSVATEIHEFALENWMVENSEG